ncbi:hypothetical protein IL306_008724 [Fusarium sp. DS 682]|nr:hypothetical protein IL306_008724 [Fusarium sp. DS 682]
MSGAPTPSGGSFGKFRIERPPPEPRKRDYHPQVWDKLVRAIPRTEEEWQAARYDHDFDEAERIPRALSRRLGYKTDLYTVAFVAGCYVDAYSHGNKSQAYQKLKEYLGNLDLAEATLDKYMSSVTRLVKSLDVLYERGLWHRAYELVLYNQFH